MRISSLGRLISPAAAALILALGLLVVPARAQDAGSGNNPTAQAVSERQLLDELNKIRGRVTIPDGKAATLQQPQGRDYQGFHERVLPWIGGIAILGMLVVLALFYFVRGRIRVAAGESGVRILRFNAIERLAHWTTATAFIILAVTGLNLVFGKRLLMPLIGPDAFSAWSFWAKYAHDFVAWAFMLGVLVMLVAWVWDNLPDRYDANWLKVGGGFFDKSNRTHPPAARFNTGQKLIFWAVLLGGIALSVSGIYMLFPFSFADINGMQTAQYVHAVVGVLLIAVIIAHIYIGTLGMEGAYEAMVSGTVDLNWAKEHHSAWVAKQQAKTGDATPETSAEPAE
ncbi:formate dehydrogenase subunit gamma [Mesorhizobium sp. M7A.F.Ca.US.006.04.2.1]|uniref:formate dehydrogenase subunit gamma n=1 Tax=unclassified Mesorhizobium TaxID=325217 RepID=UPI0007EDC77E|nr:MULTISPECIES: formate dehydrogenase subunit gamma [unclassified Mesorhizobium]ARP65624.1 formate dehydrogenase subunit gamma [Mesorhizobium sp. WSM1497]MBZ9889158.1 formate dehydrogenase subunit gamma [Mesorhizobium sp. BR1-1-3]RUX75955.1 formate dehydrogenase subunit gamma [Mesorhizobium sp. M7A.F.Ca.US.005.03.1.1]RUY17230.1 formate dehydrogenase subunit gamma [Mesorhizobium sp. M7A.F.Ca.US.005.03.2.1]RUY27140.1 formate dehydrogenase subunit gamma [Mesorhizobium sp. M7A.F.Ca.US.001.04.2.1]